MEIKKIVGFLKANTFQVFNEGSSFFITVPKGTKMEEIEALALAKINANSNSNEEVYDL